MNNNTTQKYSKGFQKNGWSFVCSKEVGSTEESHYWTKQVLGKKVWKKEIVISQFSYGGFKALYHVEGTKTENGYPKQHNSFKELKYFIKQIN